MKRRLPSDNGGGDPAYKRVLTAEPPVNQRREADVCDGRGPLTPTPTPPPASFYQTLAQTPAQIPGAAPPHSTSGRISRPPPKVKIEPGVVVIDLTLDESDNERGDTYHTPNRKLGQPVVNDGGGADAGADEEDASPVKTHRTRASVRPPRPAETPPSTTLTASIPAVSGQSTRSSARRFQHADSGPMDKYTRVLPAPAPGRNSTADLVTGDTSLPRNALDITPNGYLTRTADVLPDLVDAENAHQINPHVDLPLLGLMAQDPAKRDIFPDFLRLVGKTAKAKLMPAFRVMRSAQSARGPAPTPFPNWELNAGTHPSVDGGGPLNELFYRFLMRLGEKVGELS